ncbi:MAG: LysR family transcriptional regulator [Algicola sp.]|nr:LysR family transcriptional regulator [Algicola sp.]
MKRPDLNLLVIFDAIMMEESIGGAATRLCMTQPAVSNAVARLRQALGDPLFVKKGRGIEPTAYAASLWHQIAQPMNQIRDAFETAPIEPAKARRRFKIALPDLIVDLIWLPLRQLIEREAPNIDLLAVPLNFKHRERILSDATADLVICLGQYLNPRDRKTKLIQPKFVCAMRKDHPLAAQELTLEKFQSAEHLLVTASGDDHSLIDTLLGEYGLVRRVAMTVNHYSAIPVMLKGSDLITVVVDLAVAEDVRKGHLILKQPPLDIAPLPLCVAWHARHDRDLMLLWLKDKVADLIGQHWKV